tara:strand:+ start:45 stop:296 length:252 start_codon:yes stop_codon:yes gene_type:complete
MVRELITITERAGEAEYTWYKTIRDAQTDQEILEGFFGELDLDEPKHPRNYYLTKDWSSEVWVDKRKSLSNDEEATLLKFNII